MWTKQSDMRKTFRNCTKWLSFGSFVHSPDVIRSMAEQFEDYYVQKKQPQGTA